MKTLSILIPSVPGRWNAFSELMVGGLMNEWNALDEVSRNRVQFMFWSDNKIITLGAKRNQMIDAATGDYVVFVDDDDRVEPDYIRSLLDGIDVAPDVDVITFGVSVRINGAEAKLCRYSMGFKRDFNRADGYYRLPNHLMCVKRELAVKARFPELTFGEDAEYARRLKPLLVTEWSLNKVLYHYDFNSETTETHS